MDSVGARIRQRIAQVGLSQSELARRAGISQSTIAGLLSGKARSSSHLHVLARELRTTPAYLSGEVDDPELDAPNAPALDHDQMRLLRLFDTLDSPARSALMLIVERMAR